MAQGPAAGASVNSPLTHGLGEKQHAPKAANFHVKRLGGDRIKRFYTFLCISAKMPRAGNCLTLGLAFWPTANAAGSAAACVLQTGYGMRRKKNSLNPPPRPRTSSKDTYEICVEIWINNKCMFFKLIDKFCSQAPCYLKGIENPGQEDES